MIEEIRLQSETEDGVFNNISWLFDEIKVNHSFSRFSRKSCVVTNRSEDVVRLHFGLKGNYYFTYNQLNTQFDLIGGHHNIMFSKGFDILVQNRNLEIETFGVQFSRRFFTALTGNDSDALNRFCGAIESGKGVIFSKQWGAVNPEIECAIRQITNCKYKGKMKQILMLSKCLELLILSVEGCTNSSLKSARYVNNKSDRERIIAARDMVNDHIQSPLTLSEVAQKVGLNEFKLKRGFKEMFNNTVFGYLAEQRLILGYDYLRDTQKTAAEIAYLLGYASPQHFNNAFKKRFGVTPFFVRKSN